MAFGDPLAANGLPERLFDCVENKAWERQIELVVYDPATVGSPALLLAKGEMLGTVISDLDVGFRVKRSREFAENTAEFKVYNAKAETRAKLTQPGMRVRFSAGYRDTGGPVGIFWGSVCAGAHSKKEGTEWVTVLPCISSLTESLGSEDIATWSKSNPKATQAQKQEKAASAINRIPVSLSYAPGYPIRKVLQDFQGITGLAVLGAEGLPFATLENGFTFAGGVRGALVQFKKQCLTPIGWTFHIDNGSIFVYPVDESKQYTVISAYLTLDTGHLSLTDKTKTNIPPKLVKDAKGKLVKVPVPRSYEVKCLLNPKLGPNTLVTVNTPSLDTTLLVDSVEFVGDNYGGEYGCTFEGHVYGGQHGG